LFREYITLRQHKYECAMTVSKVVYTSDGGPRLQHVNHIGKSGTAYVYDSSSSLLYNKQAQNDISTIK